MTSVNAAITNSTTTTTQTPVTQAPVINSVGDTATKVQATASSTIPATNSTTNANETASWNLIGKAQEQFFTLKDYVIEQKNALKGAVDAKLEAMQKTSVYEFAKPVLDPIAPFVPYAFGFGGGYLLAKGVTEASHANASNLTTAVKVVSGLAVVGASYAYAGDEKWLAVAGLSGALAKTLFAHPPKMAHFHQKFDFFMKHKS